MRNWRVLLAFLAGIVVARIAIPIIELVDKPNCVNQIVREFPSPNKEVTAIVVLSSCMLAPDATSVAIKGAGERFYFDHYDSYLFIVKDNNNIEVEWNRAVTGIINTPGITIIYDRPSQINRQVVVDRMEPISYIERQNVGPRVIHEQPTKLENVR
jgi:hypothetical protein